MPPEVREVCPKCQERLKFIGTREYLCGSMDESDAQPFYQSPRCELTVAERDLAVAKGVLEEIRKFANHVTASRALAAGDSWKNIGCNMIDSIQAIIKGNLARSPQWTDPKSRRASPRSDPSTFSCVAGEPSKSRTLE